jgi:uncharacterized protein (TIGR00369 family)
VGDIFGATIPFADLCGIESIGEADGLTRLRVTLAPEHGNNIGIVHGGLVATLLDIAMGTASRLAAGAPVMTVDMHVAYMAVGHGVLIGEGRVVRSGRSIIFAEADVRDTDGVLVARASGIFKRAAAPKAA